MITLRKAQERGHIQNGWLESWHTFSFGEYFDPHYRSFADLRVINEDFVAAGAGFPTHPHNNMEIITYILEGSLAHKDSMGTGSVIHPGDIQRMSAGTGVTHSEFNPSPTEKTHLLQIWFFPDQKNIEPSYQQKTFSAEQKRGKFCLVVSKTGRDGSISLNQDMDMSVALLDGKETIEYPIKPERKVWIQLARGEINVNGLSLKAGDGAAVETETSLLFTQPKQAEIVLFDMQA